MSILSVRVHQLLSKQVSGIKNLDVVWWALIASWVLFFFWNVVGVKYTGWDTHEIGFVNFLYFSDALRSLSLPMWNPLIQSGTFFPTFFNVGSYTPFQWIFISLSYVINPVYAYELMIQTSVMIGAVGFYLLLRNSGNNKYVALFGANAFFLSVLMPITGQISFVISLGALPWLLLFCHEILLGESKISWGSLIFWAAMAASFMASGYPWMNIVDLAITFLYACNLVWLNRAKLSSFQQAEVRRGVMRLIVFLAGVAILLLCYYLPGYLSMKFNYQHLEGDYISLEPRLRGLASAQSYPYDTVTAAIVSVLDPRILKAGTVPLWSWGAGLVVVMALLYRRNEKRFVKKNIFWIGLGIFWLAYSAGKIGFIDKIPLFNANRWLLIGQFYVSICLIFIAAANLQTGFERNQVWHSSWYHLAVISVGFFIFLVFLAYFSAPILVFMFALCTILFFYYLAKSDNEARWQKAMLLLMCLNTTAFISMPITLDKADRDQLMIEKHDPNNYKTLVDQRIKRVSISENSRHIDTATEYIFNDESWLLNKTSFNHGYNPLGNPLYWYLKSEAFTRNLVSMTQSVRMERPLQRRNFVSDNAYMDALVNDVRSDEASPTVDRVNGNVIKHSADFQWSLKELKQEPNVTTIRVTANDGGYLLFNNTYFPGWEVFVDNKKADMIKVNKVFMGVLLDKAGGHKIVFRFFPWETVTLLFFPFFIMLLSLMFLLGDKRSDLKRHIFFFVPCSERVLT